MTRSASAFVCSVSDRSSSLVPNCGDFVEPAARYSSQTSASCDPAPASARAATRLAPPASDISLPTRFPSTSDRERAARASRRNHRRRRRGGFADPAAGDIAEPGIGGITTGADAEAWRRAPRGVSVPFPLVDVFVASPVHQLRGPANPPARPASVAPTGTLEILANRLGASP